ncbi:putative AAA family ATPase [Gigaspora margarita]|uniref:Putative AAA family ATPase n=1 Tax=Gigaspora margarita TaxID=4874 RepID=A0A8H3XIG0_GIGMA|nr:putative AAA family ATPase [Gigaspora margarita]
MSTASRSSSVFAPFRPPFKDSSKVNLPSYLASSHLKPSHSEPSYSESSHLDPSQRKEPSHSEPSYSESSHLEPSQRKDPPHQGCDQMPELNNGNTVIKNYYNINAKYVKIIKNAKSINFNVIALAIGNK